MTSSSFQNIAVIGAGTMGSGIAAQIANAGLPVLLLDLPARTPGQPHSAEAAIDRLLNSDPPQLMHKNRTELISTGTIDDDFDKLAACDLIIEAVIEQLPVKQALYKRLHQTISADCIVTSNTSTIPISLLVSDMPVDFARRFAITHYFNPVRFMRLLELVRGAHTDEAIMDALADFNDRILGKGVVRCGDTPGFLGNRVGVYALQLSLHEALSAGIPIEQADALISRPLGIPKTGVFGLYDLIGIDLMSDVAASLRSILPDGDAFHAVGDDPALVTAMIAEGWTGNKGKGGFYRDTESGRQVRIIEGGADGLSWRDVSSQLPDVVQLSLAAAARQGEPLDPLLADTSPGGRFAQTVLVKILAYAASLVPAITTSPQDIDDAMKLGFNWQRGPFELIDAVGLDRLAALAAELGLILPDQLTTRTQPYYAVTGGVLEIDTADKGYQPVALPDGVMRFSLARRTAEKLAGNEAASLYRLAGDLRLVEFHSKANALTGQSMQMVSLAASDPGRGIIIHNDAQHFSAGVDLNRFLAFIRAGDWPAMDAFLDDFQQAVKLLKYCPVPVVGAPSGLAAGGGFEVLMHCDKLVVHDNSTLGLVESGVGLVPSGGGVKEAYLRWYQATGDWDEAAWQTWMQVGYGRTGTSPELSAKFQYFRPGTDIRIISRDRLLPLAIDTVVQMQTGYTPPPQPEVRLASSAVLAKMDAFMTEGVNRGDFAAHNKTVAMQIATIIVADEGESRDSSEQALYDRERRAFLHLAQTDKTGRWIAAMLAG
ncbi:MAG TPA: 3-hydroxyacyl-CoA dehydrogenase [Alphaproteobacteria bacterium]|nr:3-hydroxyacyl-CoA dehydrogenase [Alphaproteobacteria bacterium]